MSFSTAALAALALAAGSAHAQDARLAGIDDRDQRGRAKHADIRQRGRAARQSIARVPSAAHLAQLADRIAKPFLVAVLLAWGTWQIPAQAHAMDGGARLVPGLCAGALLLCGLWLAAPDRWASPWKESKHA